MAPGAGIRGRRAPTASAQRPAEPPSQAALANVPVPLSRLPLREHPAWARSTTNSNSSSRARWRSSCKTYVAQKLANHRVEFEATAVTLVLLDPSYAFEDFACGPSAQRSWWADGLGVKLTGGLPAGRLPKPARQEPADHRHFLIIDEINRGQIAKVFGELYFLLEYRDQAIRLQYQRDDEEDFSLPSNLYVIGTMNTADRSIALVDLALRRRFYFVDFHPDDEPIKGLLRRWIEKKAIRRGLDRRRRRAGQRAIARGPGRRHRPKLLHEGRSRR